MIATTLGTFDYLTIERHSILCLFLLLLLEEGIGKVVLRNGIGRHLLLRTTILHLGIVPQAVMIESIAFASGRTCLSCRLCRSRVEHRHAKADEDENANLPKQSIRLIKKEHINQEENKCNGKKWHELVIIIRKDMTLEFSGL